VGGGGGGGGGGTCRSQGILRNLRAVASLKFVSLGAVTDGVAIFSSKQLMTFFSYHPQK